MWYEAEACGYYPVKLNNQATYGQEYFDKYVGYANTERGKLLTQARVDLVNKYIGPDADIVDVGIGSGSFVDARAQRGTDVGEPMVRWLLERGKFVSLHNAGRVDNLSFWDSFEHIPNPGAYAARARKYVFLSVPIFRDKAHALRSKHFRPDEHFWYFTEEGIERFFHWMQFALVESNRMEEELGREDIGTFVFQRR